MSRPRSLRARLVAGVLGIVLVIYGAYFALTYFGAQRMATETSLATK